MGSVAKQNILSFNFTLIFLSRFLSDFLLLYPNVEDDDDERKSFVAIFNDLDGFFHFKRRNRRDVYRCLVGRCWLVGVPLERESEEKRLRERLRLEKRPIVLIDAFFE